VGVLPRTTKTQWDTLLLLKELGFAVNDDNRRFESFDAALQYARRCTSPQQHLQLPHWDL
jgi:NAD-dependent DNA ligase